MLPKSYDIDAGDIMNEELTILPSLTYKLNINSGEVRGKVDGADSVAQSVVKILSTDKYAYVIYKNYGNELYLLRGKPFSYVIAEIPRMVQEALSIDNRINKVYDFQFEKYDTDSLMVNCKVDTIYGLVDIQWEVNYG